MNFLKLRGYHQRFYCLYIKIIFVDVYYKIGYAAAGQFKLKGAELLIYMVGILSKSATFVLMCPLPFVDKFTKLEYVVMLTFG